MDLVELSSHCVIRARHAPAPTRITSEDSAPDSPDEKDSTSLTSPEPAAQEPGSAQYGGWTGAAWCWWDSCGDPGRERVQICHKGGPGRDRPRRKARNINDSSRAPRPGRGLCGRFGQPAPLGRPGRALAGRAAAAAGAPTTAVTTSTTPSGPREHRFGKEPATQPGPRGPRPSPGPAGTPFSVRKAQCELSSLKSTSARTM